jgi:hypothetical protein
LPISKVCGRTNYGEKFDFEWCKNVGFVLGDGKLEPQPSLPLPEGKFLVI